jgi:hypothetical protein
LFAQYFFKEVNTAKGEGACKNPEDEPGIPEKIWNFNAHFFSPEFLQTKKGRQCSWRRAFMTNRLQLATPRPNAQHRRSGAVYAKFLAKRYCSSFVVIW